MQRSMKRLPSVSVSGCHRPDFHLMHRDGSVTMMDVQQCVDTDYDPALVEARAILPSPCPVYYVRAGTFPFGAKECRKDRMGESVVSARGH